MNTIQVTPWPSPERPAESVICKILDDEGLSYYKWGNDPHDTYSAHSHPYNKVIYVVQGSITFGLPQMDQKITLTAGDRLDLPAGVIHDAAVGAGGVVCLEGHR